MLVAPKTVGCCCWAASVQNAFPRSRLPAASVSKFEGQGAAQNLLFLGLRLAVLVLLCARAMAFQGSYAS